MKMRNNDNSKIAILVLAIVAFTGLVVTGLYVASQITPACADIAYHAHETPILDKPATIGFVFMLIAMIILLAGIVVLIFGLLSDHLND